MNVSRQINGHIDAERTSGVPPPVCVGAHIVNGSLATPSPRAPTSAGDVHEEFFGDDPLPDHEWELRSHYIPDIPADMTAEELRHVMATFGHVEDVQLIIGAGGQAMAAHVVYRLADEAECAKSALSGQESLATLRELTPMRRLSEEEKEEKEQEETEAEGNQAEEATENAVTDAEGQTAILSAHQQPQHQHQHAQHQPRTYQRYHVPPANYGRPMLPLPYMCPPGPAAGPWGGSSLYYPMSPAIHPIYGALPAPANYLAMTPAPASPANAGVHRKTHRGGDDNDGPCVRLVVHTRLVGAIIGVGGATIRKITRHQVRVDVDNNIMKRPWPPSNGRAEQPGSPGARGVNSGRPGEESVAVSAPRALQSQVVFIYGALEAVERAVLDIMKLIQHEAHSKKLDHEPDLALLVDNTLCGRIIGKGGHKIKKIRENSDVDIVLCNETIVRYDDVYHVYLAQHQFDFPSMRIISIRGELERSMEAFRQLVGSINEIRRRSPMEAAGAVFATQMSPLAGLIPSRGLFPSTNLGMRPPSYAPYMPLGPPRLPMAMSPARRPVGPHGEEPAEADTAPETGPVGLHLDMESLYVLVPHSTGGAIIGTEGRNIHKMMEVTGASVSVSKHQPANASPDHENEKAEEAIDGEPKRLVTIRAASEQSLDLALLFIFRKVQSCRREALNARANRAGMAAGGRQSPPIFTVMRVPKALMGRLCGRHHQNVANIERQSGAHIEMSQAWFSDLLPSNKPEENEGVEFDNIFIKGEYQATQTALTQLRQRLLEAFYAYSHQAGLPVSYHPYASPAPPATMAAALAAAAMQPMMGPMGTGPHPSAPAVYHPMAQATVAAQFAAGGPALAPGGGLPEGVQLYRLAGPAFARFPAHTAARTAGGSLDSSGSRRSAKGGPPSTGSPEAAAEVPAPDSPEPEIAEAPAQG